MANEAPREPDESQSLDDGQDAGKALPPIQYDEASPVDGAVAEAVEAETTDAYRTPAGGCFLETNAKLIIFIFFWVEHFLFCFSK